MRTLFLALKALFFLSCFVLLWGWIASGLPPYDQRLGVDLPPGAVPAGIGFMLPGGALALACVGLFVVRGRGTPAPFDAPKQFVAAGPYRYMRNPMYIGAWLVLIGFGLYRRSASILLFCLVWILGAHLLVLCYEEPTLRRKFGKSYEDYCRLVPRWIPKRDGHQPPAC